MPEFTVDESSLPLPKYFKLKQLLIDYIRENRHKTKEGCDFKLPSEPQLIEKYKYSQITVRRALSILEKDNLIYRINGKGTFAKSLTGKTTATVTATKNLGFFVSVNIITADPWYDEFTNSVKRAVLRYGYNFSIISPSMWRSENLKTFLDSKSVDGLIVNSTYVEHEKLLSDNFPCIFFDKPSGTKENSWISIDYREEGKTTMEFLIKNGHRKIAVLCVDDKSSVSNRSRIEGIKDVIKKYGIKYNSELILKKGWYEEEDGYKSMDGLLDKRKAGKINFTAVCITEIKVGLGAIKAIKDKKLRIPEDISVIICNGTSHLNFMEPQIAHAREPIDEVTERMVRNLVLRIKGKKDEIKERYLKPELVPGGSVKNILI